MIMIRPRRRASGPVPGNGRGRAHEPPGWRRQRRVCHDLPVRSSIKGKPAAIHLTVTRRCLVCDFDEQVTEREDTDLIGPPCTRCQAPTERIDVLTRRTLPHPPNPHAAALGRLGGLKGGPARAAALSAKRRRAIAKAAARARWSK